MFDQDATGVKLEKPRPRLFSSNLNHYEEAIEWVRTYLAQKGYVVGTAMLDPYVEVWFFYEHDGALVLILGHDDIERIAAGLYRRVGMRLSTDFWNPGQGPIRHG